MSEPDAPPVASSLPESPSPPPVRRRGPWRGLGGLLAMLLAVVLANWALVHRHVHRALAAGERNSGYTIAAYYRYGILPGTVVLDLRDYSEVSPMDLMRGLLQAAEALEAAGTSADRVLLARAGTPVFQLTGDDFREIGREYGAGQNPVYLVRTFPEKLYRADDGRSAYGTWEGGLLGVSLRQMEDVSAFARAWLNGDPDKPF